MSWEWRVRTLSDAADCFALDTGKADRRAAVGSTNALFQVPENRLCLSKNGIGGWMKKPDRVPAVLGYANVFCFHYGNKKVRFSIS